MNKNIANYCTLIKNLIYLYTSYLALPVDRTKNGTLGDIPSKCLKLSTNEIALHLLHIWNHQIIDQNIFQSLLRLADVTPVFKKGDPTSVENYRPVSVLPNVSKLFERIMLKQILEEMNRYLSQNLWI